MYTATSTWDGEFWVLVKIRSAVIIITIIIGQTKNTHKKEKNEASIEENFEYEAQSSYRIR